MSGMNDYLLGNGAGVQVQPDARRRKQQRALCGRCWGLWLSLFMLSLAAGVVGTWFGGVGIRRNNDQDMELALQALKDMGLMDNATMLMAAITGLEAKDMALMDKDMVLMQNVSDLAAENDGLQMMITALTNALSMETNDRLTKDMALMDNVTQLVAKDMTLMNDVLALQAKDMVLMDNVTDLKTAIDAIGGLVSGNVTAKLSDLMMGIMDLEQYAVTDVISTNPGTTFTLTPAPTPTPGVGQTLTLTNTAVQSVYADSFATCAPYFPDTTRMLIFGGTHVDTTCLVGGVSVNVDTGSLATDLATPTYAPTLAPAICAASSNCGAVTGLTATDGVAPFTTTAPGAVTLNSGTGIQITRSAVDTITIANAGVTSLTGDIGGSTGIQSVNVLGAAGSGITTTASPTTLSIGVNVPTLAPAICGSPACAATGIASLFGDSGPTTGLASIAIQGATGSGITTTSSASNVEIDVVPGTLAPTLVPALAPSFAPSSVVSGITSVNGLAPPTGAISITGTGVTVTTPTPGIINIAASGTGITTIAPTPTISVATPTPGTAALSINSNIVITRDAPASILLMQTTLFQPQCGSFQSDPRSSGIDVNWCNEFCDSVPAGFLECGLIGDRLGSCIAPQSPPGVNSAPPHVGTEIRPNALITGISIPPGVTTVTAKFGVEFPNVIAPFLEDGEFVNVEVGLSSITSACLSGSVPFTCRRRFVIVGSQNSNPSGGGEENGEYYLHCVVPHGFTWTPYVWARLVQHGTNDDNAQSAQEPTFRVRMLSAQFISTPDQFHIDL